jgi:hypothetical protein
MAFGGAVPAFAAPFTCSGEIYQVQSGQLRVFSGIVLGVLANGQSTTLSISCIVN